MEKSDEKSLNFTDLSGDLVFDFLKSSVASGYEVISGLINAPTHFTNDQARKVLHIKVKNLKSGTEGTLTYNYNKLKREIQNAI